MTAGTVAVLLLISGAAVLALRSVIRRKKNERLHGGCGGSCAGCPGCRTAACAEERKNQKTKKSR